MRPAVTEIQSAELIAVFKLMEKINQLNVSGMRLDCP